MVYGLVAILCGLILAARLIPSLKGVSSTLAPYAGIFGVIALILGALGLFGGLQWLALILLLAGLILAARVVPALGGIASVLDPVGGIVGVFAIVLGVVAIL